jgi:SHS2 domain-containing protein
MFALVGEASFAAGETREIEIEVEAEDPAERLRGVLRRLLAEFDRDGFFPVTIDAADDGRRSRVRAVGGAFDPGRHLYRSEIKGVTWHGLRLESVADGWIAEIVFDV